MRLDLRKHPRNNGVAIFGAGHCRDHIAGKGGMEVAKKGHGPAIGAKLGKDVGDIRFRTALR